MENDPPDREGCAIGYKTKEGVGHRVKDNETTRDRVGRPSGHGHASRGAQPPTSVGFVG
jgi:hypothetical protein